MKNTALKNIILVSLSLIGIMLIATSIVVGFNSFFELSTDINNNDVATSIAGVAFLIAIAWRYLYELKG